MILNPNYDPGGEENTFEFEFLKHNTYRVLALLLDTQSKYSFMTKYTFSYIHTYS